MFDFDGTLSAIVADPASATPRPGVVDHLEALAERYCRVGVISGRPVRFLAGVLPEGLYLSGLYGMEEWVDGEVVAAAEFRQWAETMAWAVEDLHAALAGRQLAPGVELEDKGLSVTLHHRNAPQHEAAVLELASAVAEARGLDLRPARMSVEIHPPVPTDKGDVLLRLVAGCEGAETVMFVGDDVGDLPAFEALGALRAEGLTTVGVGVASAEMAPELRAAADVVVDEDHITELLQALRSGTGQDG